MPSVGMRRSTTRIFGVVKAADGGARVLRSGRRIWPNVDEPTRFKRAHDDAVDPDWSCKGNKLSAEKQQQDDKKGGDFPPVAKRRRVRTEAKSVDTKFGIVYNRKRKRLSDQSSGDSSDRVSPVMTLRVDWSCEECWLSTVFGLMMRYSRRERLSLRSLASFFLSRPINDLFAVHGVRFLAVSDDIKSGSLMFQEAPSFSSSGVCKFFGATDRLPLLSADFAAVPRCFMDMHLTLFLRAATRSFAFVKRSLCLLNSPVVEESDSESELVSSPPCVRRNNGVSVRASNAQYRGNLGFHSVQKRRRSLRRRRARNLSHSGHNKFVSELSWRNRTSAAAATVSSRKLRSSSVLNNSSPGATETSVVPKPLTKEELDSLFCSVNILVLDSDRCTREEGFSARLEFVSSKEWFIVIKKDGVIRYRIKARKTMRPCSCNRFTHSIVWVGDNGWKLEFCDRQDWLGFKEIYKECYERNVLEQNARVIPIPGVREVCGYADDLASFSMPVPYISVKEDEVSRAMARTSALYDMDSEDEEWMERQQLEQDTFELMIDGFEKYYFHNPADDLLDEKAASVASLSYLGRQDVVVEAVYDYWARKRKQRKAPLLRVFQVHQAKKTPLFFKPVFRKRRSFKRQGSQLHGKSKQSSLVSVKAAKQEAWEEQNVFFRVKEAKALADTSMEIAMSKRRRAQVLAENADLAVYKAMVSRRIAQAMKLAGASGEVAASLFLN